jgi:hypothetical protein
MGTHKNCTLYMETHAESFDMGWPQPCRTRTTIAHQELHASLLERVIREGDHRALVVPQLLTARLGHVL